MLFDKDQRCMYVPVNYAQIYSKANWNVGRYPVYVNDFEMCWTQLK